MQDEEKGDPEVKVPDEKQQEKIRSAYKTPSHPCLFVHPNPKVKSGKFDCRVESLSVLLDYRWDSCSIVPARSPGGGGGGGFLFANDTI